MTHTIIGEIPERQLRQTAVVGCFFTNNLKQFFMNDIDKLIKSILILLFLVSFFMLLFHRIKYKNSGYQRFEYYLNGQTDFGDEIYMLNVLFICAFSVGCIVLFGYLFSLLIF